MFKLRFRMTLPDGQQHRFTTYGPTRYEMFLSARTQCDKWSGRSLVAAEEENSRDDWQRAMSTAIVDADVTHGVTLIPSSQSVERVAHATPLPRWIIWCAAVSIIIGGALVASWSLR